MHCRTAGRTKGQVPVVLSRIMVTDSTLHLLLDRYACSCGRDQNIRSNLYGETVRTSASVKSGSSPKKMTCGLGSLGIRRFLLYPPPPPR